MDTGRTNPIRKAMASGEYDRALRLWGDYAAGIREEIGRGACTRARMAEAREFLNWARVTVLCARTRAQNQLNAIHVAQRYGPAPSQPESSLRTSL
jgi:hypothetical protein